MSGERIFSATGKPIAAAAAAACSGVGGRAGERLRNAVGGEYGRGFFGFEPAGTAAREHPQMTVSNSTGIRLERIGASRRRLHQERLVALIADAVQEPGDRRLGRFVGRDARRTEATRVRLPRNARRARR